VAGDADGGDWCCGGEFLKEIRHHSISLTQ